MADNVKSIFKILIKVPIIILVSYLIFNLFAFTYTYYRLLGFSYVALQTTVENNYIPQTEAETLQRYLASLESGVVQNLTLGCDTNLDNGTSIDISEPSGDNERVQYGTPITVTVSAKYVWIFPLVNSMNGNESGSFERLTYNANEDNNIVISYTIPGLKYYSDLS